MLSSSVYFDLVGLEEKPIGEVVNAWAPRLLETWLYSAFDSCHFYNYHSWTRSGADLCPLHETRNGFLSIPLRNFVVTVCCLALLLSDPPPTGHRNHLVFHLSKCSPSGRIIGGCKLTPLDLFDEHAVPLVGTIIHTECTHGGLS